MNSLNVLNVTHLVGVKGVVDWEVGEREVEDWEEGD